MKLTIGLRQTIVTVQRSKEQATIGLCWSEFFLYFSFIANISKAIMSVLVAAAVCSRTQCLCVSTMEWLIAVRNCMRL